MITAVLYVWGFIVVIAGARVLYPAITDWLWVIPASFLSWLLTRPRMLPALLRYWRRRRANLAQIDVMSGPQFEAPHLISESAPPTPSLWEMSWTTTVRFQGDLSAVEGNETSLRLLQLMADAAKAGSSPMEPVLLYGSGGSGIITWAEALCNQLGRPLYRAHGARLRVNNETAVRIALGALPNGSTLLITEVDSLGPDIPELIAEAVTVLGLSLICTAYDKKMVPFALRKLLDTQVRCC